MSGAASAVARAAEAPPGRPLRVDPGAVPAAMAGQGDPLRAALRAILGSAAFDLAPDGGRLWLRGQDTRHHAVDPALPAALAAWGLDGPDAVGAFRETRPGYGLCFEDSWSGWLLAPVLAGLADDAPLVVLHLDDHGDRMPTLLSRVTDGALVNPATGAPFDAASRESWAEAIAHGVVTIGNWLTALGQGRGVVHIRHLRPHPADAAVEGRIRPLRAGTVRHPLLPDHAFAVLEDGPPPGSGTLMETADPVRALADLPPGVLAVHVDLDYFVNDFNGNPGTRPLRRTADLARAVRGRMDALFAALAATRRPVAAWVAATSPGFCGAPHWPGLLDRLERGIVALGGPEGMA
ncbi:hypothetical protein [Roseospira navarrensis]|uniref:Uncharacterized protein n=1 Tax=Roseospira navarrensis TaxID=140058 RepID=A0A7X1ZGT0_9PROT|nr:hypothetical protein [Roseospira navarrensis]MQX38097.1 hypothetical protein [Roseospira navarrensis]